MSESSTVFATDAGDTLADRVRQDFPFFERNPGCIYLDNAATSLTPRAVIARLDQFYSEISANAARGTYGPAELATHLFENARATIAELLGCEPPHVAVTGGCTGAINLVAVGMPLPADQAVAVSLFEHHANLVPWMNRHPLIWFDPLRDGVDELDRLLSTADVGLLAVTAGSNVSGAVLPVNNYAAVAHEHGIPVLADCAQFAPHFRDELASLDADFIAISVHKMLGPFGIGALGARGDWFEQLNPPWLGGGAVDEVTTTSFRLKDGPGRLEAGTPPIAEVIAFGDALEYVRGLGPERIEAYESSLLARLLDRLRRIPRVRIVDDAWKGRRTPLASIAIEDDLVSAEQLSRMLWDRFQICARAGHHCAHPYVNGRGFPSGTLRLSASFYNTPGEIDSACDAIEEILDTLL
jgi:cysteine desulfurase/selenocysteine lyase